MIRRGLQSVEELDQQQEDSRKYDIKKSANGPQVITTAEAFTTFGLDTFQDLSPLIWDEFAGGINEFNNGIVLGT